jgi:glycosyltransferase involved in cell wall biosynthesis
MHKYPKTKTVFEIHSPIIRVISSYPTDQLSSVSAIIVPSNWSKETIINLHADIKKEKICVVPNIVDSKKFSKKGDAFILNKTLIWVGKIADYKNWREAIEIGYCFIDLNKEWEFLLVTGGEPIKPKDVDYVISQSIGFGNCIKRTRWLHNLSQDNMGRLYRGVARGGGFLLSSSKAESFCLVIHEAMRCGVPVVSSRVGPIPEIIDDGISGLLYNLGDIQEGVGKCSKLADSIYRKRIITGGQKKLIPYNLKNVENSYLKTLNNIITGNNHLSSN